MKYASLEEKKWWKANVTVEMMSDEEDCEDGLKVKSPQWRSVEVGQLIAKLDAQYFEVQSENCRQSLSKRRIVSDSPMKRQPSKSARLLNN